MHDESLIAGPVRLSRTLILAVSLAAVGLLRHGSDLLTDIDPIWATGLDGSPLRYLVVRVSDGSRVGNLNVKDFKLLAIPCGPSVVFLGLRPTKTSLLRRNRPLTEGRMILPQCAPFLS